MRFLLLSLLALALVMGPATIHSQESGDARRLLQSYFFALQNGDTSEILNLITGPMLAKRRRLLEDNPQYGEFLRDRYKMANFNVFEPLFLHKELWSLKASIDFDGHDQSNFIYSFSVDNRDGTLKIYSEEEVQ